MMEPAPQRKDAQQHRVANAAEEKNSSPMSMKNIGESNPILLVSCFLGSQKLCLDRHLS